MKNWLVPIALLGVSGVGLMFASERARKRIRQFVDRLAQSEDPFGEFNKAVDEQLQNIQSTLDRLSEALEASH